jgi:hypothetical protein
VCHASISSWPMRRMLSSRPDRQQGIGREVRRIEHTEHLAKGDDVEDPDTPFILSRSDSGNTTPPTDANI